jgi:aspartyl-tRNA(Asn)/glutamyl-tRNA(Gln) amidotransferase subunit A
MLGEEILYLPISELGRHLRQKSFSPVELAQSYLDRSHQIGPKLNAYVTITSELAIEQARAAEKEIAAGHYRGPLHGIPYALKDLVAVKGYRTTWGARPYVDQTFDYNATIVEKLNAAGAVLIGKAAMIELAGGLGYSNGFAALTGPARNPWNTECWTCGSSSGSGAVVAAGLAPWAIGSDTRGSIICPTSWCGISGMRPSFGRVSRYGAMAIAWTMDKLGPMAHRGRLRLDPFRDRRTRSQGSRFAIHRTVPLSGERSGTDTPAHRQAHECLGTAARGIRDRGQQRSGHTGAGRRARLRCRDAGGSV